MSAKHTHGIVNTVRQQDQFTQDMRKRCEKVARELRVIGDALNARLNRTLHLETAQEYDNKRIYLQYIICLRIVNELSLKCS